MPPKKPVPRSSPLDENTPGKEKSEKDNVAIEDLTMPRTMVQRLAKGVLPPNTQIQKDPITAMSKSATVFISYLSHSANLHTLSSTRRTISPQDVFLALRDTGFDALVPRLELELARHNDIQTSKRIEYRKKVRKSVGGEDPKEKEKSGTGDLSEQEIEEDVEDGKDRGTGGEREEGSEGQEDEGEEGERAAKRARLDSNGVLEGAARPSGSSRKGKEKATDQSEVAMAENGEETTAETQGDDADEEEEDDEADEEAENDEDEAEDDDDEADVDDELEDERNADVDEPDSQNLPGTIPDGDPGSSNATTDEESD